MLDCFSVLELQEPDAAGQVPEGNEQTRRIRILHANQQSELVAEFDELEGDVGEFLSSIQDRPLIVIHGGRVAEWLGDWCENEGYLPPHNPLVDLLILASYVWPVRQFQTFSELIEFLIDSGYSSLFQGRDFSQIQNGTKAETMLQVFRLIQQTIASWPFLLLQQLTELSAYVDQGMHVVLQNILNGTHSLGQIKAPSGRQIIHQLLFREVEVPQRIEREANPFLTTDAVDYMAADGPMKQLFPAYEPRAGQLAMLQHVAQALDESRHLIVEAGTGTGKSLGYLIPAAQFAATTGEKVIIATHTLHLQTQLLERDVPLVEQLLKHPVQFAIMKGRTNYVCMRKVAAAFNSLGLVQDFGTRAFLMKILVWLKDTKAGDREELPLQAAEQEQWTQIQSEAETCINKKCPWFKYCYYHRARAVAQSADVIITNHSLVLTDLKAEHNVLPGYSYLVLDEAHHLEDGATKHLGTEIPYYRVMGVLNRLAKDAKTGQLPLLKQRLAAHFQDNMEQAAAWVNKIDQLLQDCSELRQMADEMFDLLSQYVINRTDPGDGGRTVVRLREEDRQQERWNPVALTFDNFQTSVQTLRKHVKTLEAEQSDLMVDELAGLIQDIIGLAKEIDRIWEDLTTFYQATDENTVTWIEREERGNKGFVTLYTAPIDVGPLLDRLLFAKKESIILTSATLTVNQNFDHVVQRLGLSRARDDGELQTLSVESPFRYHDQALLCVPTDMPNMTEAGDTFLAELNDTLVKLGRISQGRMLVLFTSYRMMHEVYARTKEEFQKHGIQLFAQNIDSFNRHQLVQTFKNHEQAVLFGTNSFWEGVDIPGEQLSLLAIVRLPFWPPNQPVVEARTELLKSRGRNAFSEYAVPQAIVRFKQGFGRLVRSTSDVGAVVVFDRRIVDSSYGKRFIRSLPRPRLFQGSRREIYAAIYHWLRP